MTSVTGKDGIGHLFWVFQKHLYDLPPLAKPISA